MRYDFFVVSGKSKSDRLRLDFGSASRKGEISLSFHVNKKACGFRISGNYLGTQGEKPAKKGANHEEAGSRSRN